jgi:hypothetical protein
MREVNVTEEDMERWLNESKVTRSQGMCGDCIGRLFEGPHPVDGYQCPLCRHIWLSAATRAASRVTCLHCFWTYPEDGGHICPKIPAPRRREAILATRNKS